MTVTCWFFRFKMFTSEILLYFGLVLSLSLAPTSHGVRNIHIGVSMISHAGTPYDIERVGPAIDIAIEKVNQNFLNDSYQLVKIQNSFGDVCSNARASGLVADMYYQRQISALIGPACSYALDPVARLASYWNIPIITGLGDGGIFKNKTDYGTLTRLAYCQCRLRKVFGSMFEEFNWVDIAIIYDVHDVHSEVLGTTLKAGLQKQNIFPHMFPYYGSDNHDFEGILTEVSSVSRIIIVLAHGDSVRKFLITAHAMGLVQTGEYVFFDVLLFPFPGDYWGDHDWYRGDNDDRRALEAYEAVFRISLQVPTSTDWSDFTNDVKQRALNDYNFTFGSEEVNFFIGAFHDAVYLYGMTLNESLSSASDIDNGYQLTRKMWNRTFQGVTGDVILDDNGDRDTSYSILDFNPLTQRFQVVANFFGDNQVYNPVPGVFIHWAAGKTSPPANEPVCGFRNEKDVCKTGGDVNKWLTLVLGTITTLFLVILFSFVLFRYLKKERELLDMSWVIKYEDIQFKSTAISNISLATELMSLTKTEDSCYRSEFLQCARYKGIPVLVKKLGPEKIDVNRNVLLEIKKVRDTQHENLARFIGVCLEPEKSFILQECFGKGTLEDVICNDNIKLDNTFKLSLLRDISKGLHYLHFSPLRCHGRLTSSSCYVDSRFMVKLADFGLDTFHSHVIDYDQAKERTLLWRAPEELSRKGHRKGSQKGDIYSLAIISSEVLHRTSPYESYKVEKSMEDADIIQRIKKKEVPPFRPSVARVANEELVAIIQKCWSDDPEERPDITAYSKVIRRLLGFKHDSLVEALLHRMEKYAANLEDIIDERTGQLMVEKKRSEELLYQILPKSVANDLKAGQPVIPEHFNSVTIYFSDMVNFTGLSSILTPLQVVAVLNHLYTQFDSIIDNYDVYKVETIGDAYMVVSGLPKRNGDQHVEEICRLALNIICTSSKSAIPHINEIPQIRIGIHSGPCVAGVVGQKMPRYCLFGDTVNTSSRMETTGLAMKIHISDSTKQLLNQNKFIVETRGNTTIKGKGEMLTHWLLGERQGLHLPASDQEVPFQWD